MPVTRRLEIIKWAKENNVLIIEDDYNGELRYSTHPMPCVQNYDTENTVYLGSFSKILLPSVRISYMVLPQKLTDEYNKIKKYTNQTASKTEQIALAKYINNGKLDVHLRKARRIYLEKSNLMLSNIKKYFGTSVKIVFNETSLYVSLIFKDKTIDDSVIKKIDDALIKTMQFNKAENMIVLSFSIDKNKDKEFYRYVLLLKFTYMTCGNCVTAQGYFDALDEADRDHFLVVAAHQPEGMPMDPYWCSEGISLKSKMKVGVYSTWSYNFEDLVVGIGAGAISKTSIRQQISHAEKTYPAVCGVKATSTLEGSTAKIEATVQFQQAGNYKIACVLVENNIENKETYNTFNHVLRAAQTDMEGDAVTPAVTAPEERTFNFEATIGEDWNAENCAFVVYVFKEEANGKYIVNNGAECTVDGSVDYRYEL